MQCPNGVGIHLPRTKDAVGVIGDLAHALTFKVKTYLNEPIKALIKECIRYTNESTKDVGKWAREVTKKL